MPTPKHKKAKYLEWTRIPWDGNPSLGYECWRKSFGRGHVSVGIGEFLTVCFSYGVNSDDSCSSTRWDYDRPPISEEDMMRMVDAAGGKANRLPKRNKNEGHQTRAPAILTSATTDALDAL